MTGVQTCALPICFPVTIRRTVLGVQYPNMAEKREADSSMEPPMKISKGESSHSHHNGGTGATNFITTKESAKVAKQTFKKVFQIQGESLRWRRGQNSTAYCTSQGLNAATFQNKNWMIDTSMQVLDPNRMEWYMSPSEFKSLPWDHTLLLAELRSLTKDIVFLLPLAMLLQLLQIPKLWFKLSPLSVWNTIFR